MSLEDAFVWLGETPPGKFLAESTPAFAVTQAAHILSFGILGGAILALDLAAMGVVFRTSTLAQTGRQLFPVFLAALIAAAASGILLVAAGPMKYFTNPLFPLKLGALAVALAAHVALYPVLTGPSGGHNTRLIGALLGLLSILLWFSVAILGRWIGLI